MLIYLFAKPILPTTFWCNLKARCDYNVIETHTSQSLLTAEPQPLQNAPGVSRRILTCAHIFFCSFSFSLFISHKGWCLPTHPATYDLCVNVAARVVCLPRVSKRPTGSSVLPHGDKAKPHHSVKQENAPTLGPGWGLCWLSLKAEWLVL